MRLVVRILGTEVFALETGAEEAAEDEGEALSGGSTCSYPVGFTASPGDQRWESSPDLE